MLNRKLQNIDFVHKKYAFTLVTVMDRSISNTVLVDTDCTTDSNSESSFADVLPVLSVVRLRPIYQRYADYIPSGRQHD